MKKQDKFKLYKVRFRSGYAYVLRNCKKNKPKNNIQVCSIDEFNLSEEELKKVENIIDGRKK